MTGPTGIHCVLYALFDRAGRLDRGAMRAQTERVLAAGVDGIVVLGLATEVGKLSPEERREVIAWAAEDVGGAAPLSVTIAGETLAAQRALIYAARDLGADQLILQPPGRLDDEGSLLDWFTAVLRSTDLPAGIQNAPQFMAKSLSVDDLVELARRASNFAFVKAEGNAVDLAGIIDRLGPVPGCLGGRGGLEMTDCLGVGAQGFVLAPDAIDHAMRLYDHWVAGDRAAADDAYAHALPAMVFAMQSIEHLVCYGKRIFALRAGFDVHDRAPGLTPTEAGLRMAGKWAQHLGPIGDRGAEVCK